MIASVLCAAGGCLSPLAAHAQGSGLPGYAILPLNLIGAANQATIRVTINGESVLLILDTGANTSVLDSGFYKGIRTHAEKVPDSQLPPEVPRHTKANGENAEIGTISHMQAGAMNFGSGPVVVMDLSRTVTRYNDTHPSGMVVGLMGEDILRRYGAIIDWRRRGVYFNTDPSKRVKLGPGLVQGGWTAVPMHPSNSHHFMVDCTVENKPVRLMVDTGAQFTSFASGIVPLHMRYNRLADGSMNRLAPLSGRMSMIGMDTAVNPATVENWKIGNYQVASWNVGVQSFPPHLLEEESEGEGPVLGLLGAEFLAAHNAIIDIAGSTLYLKPRAR